MCSLWNVFSTQCDLYRMCSLSNVVYIEYVLYRCDLYRTCSLTQRHLEAPGRNVTPFAPCYQIQYFYLYTCVYIGVYIYICKNICIYALLPNPVLLPIYQVYIYRCVYIYIYVKIYMFIRPATKSSTFTYIHVYI